MQRPSRFLIGLIAGLLPATSPVIAADYEPLYESFNAVTVLPSGLLTGPDYRILTEVVNRGMMNHYRIETAYGPMRAHSDRELNQRLREINALARLKAMHEGVVVARSAGRAVWQTGKSVVRAVSNPVSTAQDIGRGIEHMLRRTRRRLNDAYDSARQGMNGSSGGSSEAADDPRTMPDKALDAGARFLRKRLGVNRAYRRLAGRLGVDPYTNNPILVNELYRLAGHSAGASLGSRMLVPRIPGLIGAVEEVSTLVMRKDKLDLLLHNEDTLAELGIPETIFRAFTGNPHYSPTMQTALTASVAAMRGVNDLWRLVDHAARADSPAEARFYTTMSGILSLYHGNRSPLLSIIPDAAILPLALTRDGRTLAVLPVDRLRWTPDMAEWITRYSRHSPPSRYRELWVTGRISPSARAGLDRHDWVAFTRADQRLSAVSR